MSASQLVVRLENFPVRLFDAAHEEWEAMLREYTLRGMGGSSQPFDAAEITRAGNALRLLADAADELAQPAGPAEQNTQVALVPVSAPADFAGLQAVLQEARRLATMGELLGLPSLPELAALRNWLCEEVINQAAGVVPTPWRLDVDAGDPDVTTAPHWDDAIQPAQDVAWLVGDDHNRIVASSAAALTLLGWSERDLVGQRLVVVIPPQLREAHIAGFTRSVVSGTGALLGQPLSLPALTRDGRQIPITLTLTRHAARGGRHVYLARIAPALTAG